MRSTPEQLSKTSKTRHFGVLERKSCDSSLKYENFKITQPDCQDIALSNLPWKTK